MKITGKVSGKSDDKRFRLPGVKIEYTCPGCGDEGVKDVDAGHYFSYPVLGKSFEYTMWCDKCDHEWKVNLQIDITLKIIEWNV